MLGTPLKYQIAKTLNHSSAVILDDQRDPFERYRAFRIQEDGKTVYHFLASPERLSELAYVYRLDATDEEGYQRDLKLSKLRDINLYLMEGNNYFPNNLILCFDTLLNDVEWPDFNPDPGQANASTQFGTLCLPKVYCSGEVIDGQHRLYGYFDATEDQHCLKVLRERSRTDRLSIVAVSDPNSDDRARLFVDINSNQTKVNIRRTWALTGRVHPNTEMGFIARVVQKLNEGSVFKNKIEIPGVNKPKNRNLNIANLGKGLMDRGILNREVRWSIYFGNRKKIGYSEDVDASAKEIERFFRPLKAVAVSRFVLTNNGANVMLRIYAELLKYEAKPGKKLHRSRTNSIIRSSLIRVLKKNGGVDDALKQTSSEAGRGDMARDIAELIAKRKGLKTFAEGLLD
jgi:DGQHR domain-containing protein